MTAAMVGRERRGGVIVCTGEGDGLGLLVLGQHRVDVLEGLVDLLSHLGAREHDLSRHEDEQHDLGLHHAVDETREQLWLVLRVVYIVGIRRAASGR